MRLLYAGLRVTNLARSLRFYQKVLGLRIVNQGDTRSWGGGRWVALEDPISHRQVELNWYPRGSLFYRKYSAGESLDHLDFSVGSMSAAEFSSVFKDLIARGGGPTKYRPETTEGWMGCITDPDGIWIVIGRSPTPQERRRMNAPEAPRPRAGRRPRRRRPA